MWEGLAEGHRCLVEFKRILEASFGPWGKDVLLRTDTGNMHVTKDGDSILRHLEIKHPIGRLITNSVRQYKQETGDFSKSFILVLAHFVERLTVKCMEKRKFTNSVSMFISEACQCMANLQDMLSSESLIRHINESLRRSAFHGNDVDLTVDVMNGLFNSFVCNTFSSAACQQMKRLCDELFQIVPLSKKNTKRLIDDFDHFCVLVHGLPLRNSKVLSGKIIEREPTPRHAQIQPCRFLLICNDLVRGGADITLTANEGFFGSQETCMVKFYTGILNMLRQRAVNVVLVEEQLPSLFQSMLTTHKIVYVEHVSKEDITMLAKYYNISVLSGLYDISSIQDVHNVVGCSAFFKSCVLGKRYCCHVGPIQVTDRTSDRLEESSCVQIVLCATSEGIGSQYREAIHSYLKVLHNSFGSKGSRSCTLLPSGGAFELVVADYCHQMDRSKFSCIESEIIDWFGESLLQVPKHIFSNSNKSKAKRLFFNCKENHFGEAGASLTSVVCVNGTTGALEPPSESNLFEPFNSKMVLISNILAVCSQIARIDQCVPMVRSGVLVKKMSTDEESQVEAV